MPKEDSFTVHLFTDLDRTLLPNGLHDADLEANTILFELCSMGHVELTYVTGRSLQLTQKAIRDYALPKPKFVITDVGAHIYADSNNAWQHDPEWHDTLANDWPDDATTELHHALSNLETLSLQEPDKQTRFKLSYYFERAQHEKIVEHVHDALATLSKDYKLVSSIDEPNDIGLLDLLPPSADKLEAIRFLIDKLGLDHEHIVFSGDSGNDLPVVTSELKSLLVRNACPKVQAQAQQRCQTDDLNETLYIAQGDFLGFNGHYGSGILEGLCHFFPHLTQEIASQRERL